MAFQNSFESFEEFEVWMKKVNGDTSETEENIELELPWENGGKQPSEYTWEEFEALEGGQQIAFQDSFGSFEKDYYYLSYRDFFFGFTYRSTGIMGTELYIRNIRMYDVTKEEIIRELEDAKNSRMTKSIDDDLILGADRTLTNNKTATGASANTKLDISRMGVMRLLSLQENQDIRDGVKRAAIGDTGEVYAADFIEM